ncbi:MAG: HNH endonuclease [Chloroflexi bacterium]|jgi:5-methylcytosine-specific restriction endonuclease McrA|nr:HNH endonuclease [Chloroflexota bacterium]MBT7080343.1 HNH endonuclease [Chloroflexota bacterium]MBT7289563.1 HNH endonuclease [Chloroflexota bacterium]
MVNSAVLVLNQNYEPLNVCNMHRAVILVWCGKAEVLENGRGQLNSFSISLTIPSVIRLHHSIYRPWIKRRLTRREVFIRDGYKCQYCGKQMHELTLDHIIPRHRGGQHTWDNVTSACKKCNYKKAGNTPAEVGMKLLKKPSQPRNGIHHMVYPYMDIRYEWKKYTQGFQ